MTQYRLKRPKFRSVGQKVLKHSVSVVFVSRLLQFQGDVNTVADPGFRGWREANSKSGWACQSIIWPNFPESCMKLNIMGENPFINFTSESTHGQHTRLRKNDQMFKCVSLKLSMLLFWFYLPQNPGKMSHLLNFNKFSKQILKNGFRPLQI